MTALKKYARLEASGLWRPDPEAQRREVIVSVGDATLVLSDLKEQALAHWSLAAVARANPGETPAIYHPDGDPGETLELPADETEMIAAIEKLRRAVLRGRPHPGRLRWLGLLGSVLLVALLAVFWLPGAARNHTLGVVPSAKRMEIGQSLLKHIERVSGPRCGDAAARAALARLAGRLSAGRVVVLPEMTQASLHLPGGTIVLNRDTLEDFEEPDVAAGYVLAEQTRRAARDPLDPLLSAVGLRENFRLLTTGALSQGALAAYAERLMATPAPPPQTEALLARFAANKLRSTPYAYARDITGESVLELIEGDPMHGKLTEPLLSDPDWLRLQNICGG